MVRVCARWNSILAVVSASVVALDCKDMIFGNIKLLWNVANTYLS